MVFQKDTSKGRVIDENWSKKLGDKDCFYCHKKDHPMTLVYSYTFIVEEK